MTKVSSNKCVICHKRIITTAFKLICSICKNPCHKLCIPGVSKYDDFYVNFKDSDWFCTPCNQSIFAFNQINDDEEFITVLSEMWDVSITFSLDELNKKMFIPFEMNSEDEYHPLFQTDPDIHYYNTISTQILNSEYYLEDAFNQKIKQMSIPPKCLSMIHYNIRSIPKNLQKFEIYLETLEFQFAIIAFSETWLAESSFELHDIKDYNMEHNFRTDKRGGGVCICIHNSIDYTLRKDLDIFNEIFESRFVEIAKDSFGTSHDIVVGVIYRPPNTDLSRFNEMCLDLLSHLRSKNKLVYLLGDFNVNILHADKHETTSEFIEMMFSNMFVPLINKPTRISKTSATIIDNIFTNSKDLKDSFSGILYTDITDHFPIFYIDKCCQSEDVSYITRRSYSTRNVEKFKNSLSSIVWDDIFTIDDPQIAYTSFFKKISDTYNKCFPLRKVKGTYYNKKPWLTENLKGSIKNKNKLYARYKKYPSYFNEKIYTDYQKVLQKTLRFTEREYYDSKFSQYKNDLVKSWRVLKEVINRRKKSKMSSKFLINGKVVTDNNAIAESFNQFYVNIGTSLASKIPTTDADPIDYVKENVTRCIQVTPVNESEVIEILKKLKNSSPGWDGISPHIVKMTYSIFIKPLVHICNLSIMNGVFPNELKVAKVIPLYKGGDSMLLVNYRPVSILPVLSKLFERLMYNRLFQFIEELELLYYLQFGFRKFHSTSLALMYLVDKISKALHEGDYVLGVFIDFSKAFDTVNHEILLRKIWHYGIRGVTYTWLQSYLDKRSQYVTYNSIDSSAQLIKCGVPQGSILGPLLFLLYINDIALVSDVILPILFADDTNVFLTGKNVNDLISSMNLELEKIMIWLYANKLSLNVNKTHYLVFRSSGMAKPVFDIQLQINDQHIKEDIKTKFLGVFLDNKLTWAYHIQYIKNKIAKGIGVICRARRLLNIKTLCTLYHCFVYPYLNYAAEVWADTTDKLLSSVVKLQKKVIRIINHSQRDEHTRPLFVKFNILRLEEIHFYKVALTMFKVFHNDTPMVFTNLFTRNSHVHEYETRQRLQFHVPIARTNYMKRAISVKGVSIWNKLLNKVNHECLLLSYKIALKRYLINNTDIVTYIC